MICNVDGGRSPLAEEKRTKTSAGKMTMTPLFYVMTVPSSADILLTNR
jgi:hypothetical protein